MSTTSSSSSPSSSSISSSPPKPNKHETSMPPTAVKINNNNHNSSNSLSAKLETLFLDIVCAILLLAGLAVAVVPVYLFHWFCDVCSLRVGMTILIATGAIFITIFPEQEQGESDCKDKNGNFTKQRRRRKRSIAMMALTTKRLSLLLNETSLGQHMNRRLSQATIAGNEAGRRMSQFLHMQY